MKAKFVFENIKGGKGDDLTPKDVDSKELAIGKAVEKEHTNKNKTSIEIALDHLAENDKYYSELIEKGMVDEKDAIRIYVKHFGTKKLPRKYLKLLENNVNKLFKPKNEEELLAIILETEKENIPYILEIYDKLSKMEPLDLDKAEEIIDEYTEIMPDLRSSGLKGLKHLYKLFRTSRYTREKLIYMIKEWIGWVTLSLGEFKELTNHINKEN